MEDIAIPTDINDWVTRLLRDERQLTEDTCRELLRKAEAADALYFELRKAGSDESEWMCWFTAARLLSGVAIGLNDSSWKAVADSLYELSRTSANPKLLLAHATGALEAEPDT